MTVEETEQQVKDNLSAIRSIPGGWEAMLDILWRRGLVARLRELRIRQGITRAQCAERMGVTLDRLDDIEGAEYPNPYIATLARYARALGAELDLTVYEKPDLTEPEDPGPGMFAEAAAEDAPYGPHSRACGVREHIHGRECHRNCPTCHGRPEDDEDEQYGVPA